MPIPTQLEIQRLWNLLPHPRGTFIRWFARKGDIRVGGGVDTVEELILAAYSCGGLHYPPHGMNFYVAPNPAATRAGTRHRAVDVTHWSWFLIDIDPVEPNAQPEIVVQAVLGKLGKWWGVDFSVRRPLIIHSGRGAQIWIRLSDIILDDRQQEGRFVGMSFNIMKGVPLEHPTGVCTRRTARVTNGFWLKKLAEEIGTLRGCRIDTTCADLPRVMRCPGTLNTKTNQPALLLVPSAEIFYLAQSLVEGVPPEQFIPVPVATLPSGTPWQQVFVHLTIRAQNYLTQGKDEPGRHDTMFHTALCLAERGLDRNEVRRALEYGNERWDALHPGAKLKLDPPDIEHALDTAFRRLQRASESDTLVVEGEVPTTDPEEVLDAENLRSHGQE